MLAKEVCLNLLVVGVSFCDGVQLIGSDTEIVGELWVALVEPNFAQQQVTIAHDEAPIARAQVTLQNTNKTKINV